MTATDQLVIAENTSKNTHNVVAELLGDDAKVILDLPCGEGAFSMFTVPVLFGETLIVKATRT